MGQQTAGRLALKLAFHCSHSAVSLVQFLQVGVEEGIKGAVLSAFYWGYAISQVMHLPPLGCWIARVMAPGSQLQVGSWRLGSTAACAPLNPPPCTAPCTQLPYIAHASCRQANELSFLSTAQVPGGWAAQRFGGERVLSWSFTLWSAAVLLTPGSAGNARLMAAVRVGVGLAQVRQQCWLCLTVQQQTFACVLLPSTCRPLCPTMPYSQRSAQWPARLTCDSTLLPSATAVQGFVIPAVHTVLAGWIPPSERARAVSLTTSGLYLGSAIAMLLLPSVAASLGPAALLRLVGALGLAWLALWRFTLRHVRRRQAAAYMPLHSSASGTGDGDVSGKATVKQGRPAATPWQAMLAHPAGG